MPDTGRVPSGEHGSRGEPAVGGARDKRPRGSTREAILDIALDLFTKQGYDKTSLREIADGLGFTKAALYYHFERKEDILLALHLRLHALGQVALDQLGQIGLRAEDEEIWIGLLDEFIDQVLANRKLFLLHARNQNALEQIEQSEHNDAAHEDMGQQIRRLFGDPAIPVNLRVRLACAIGAVMGSLMGANEVFADIPAEELSGLVRDAVRDLLSPARLAPAAARRSAGPTRR